MNVKIFFRTISCTIIALLLLSGCNNDVDNGLITSVNMRDKFNQTVNTFNQAEDINMTLSIKNDSTSEKTLSFTSTKQYDFVIRDGASNIVWQWSTGLTFTPTTNTIILGPTDIQTITYTWDQNIDATPTPIPLGTYTLEAYFVGYETQAAQTSLTIQ